MKHGKTTGLSSPGAGRAIQALRMRARRAGQLLLAAAWIPLSSCSPPPAVRVVQVQSALVTDIELRRATSRFVLRILQPRSSSGGQLRCTDPPTAIDNASAVLEQTLSWQRDSAEEAKLPRIRVSESQTLMAVVRAISDTSAGSIVVGRGCADNIQQSWVLNAQNRTAELALVIRNTVGRPCSGAAECEPHLNLCQIDSVLTQGYCTLTCNRNDSSACPAGSACVANPTTGGICARRCSTPGAASQECETIRPQCVRRTQPEAGCVSVCVPPSWNNELSC